MIKAKHTRNNNCQSTTVLFIKSFVDMNVTVYFDTSFSLFKAMPPPQ